MGYTDIGKLVDRWLEDPSFRDVVKKDPTVAAQQCGIQLTSEELEAVQRINWNMPDDELRARISKL